MLALEGWRATSDWSASSCHPHGDSCRHGRSADTRLRPLLTTKVTNINHEGHEGHEEKICPSCSSCPSWLIGFGLRTLYPLTAHCPLRYDSPTVAKINDVAKSAGVSTATVSRV